MKLLLLFLGAILTVGCDMMTSDDGQARKAAEAWADAYFNCNFNDAGRYVTPEGWKWLQFAASNTTEQELKLLQEAGGAGITVDDNFGVANDTIRLVTLSVTNCLKPVSPGQEPALLREGTVNVTIVKRHGDWLVRMEALPQNGMQSRD